MLVAAGQPWRSPVGPTAADEVEFDRGHPLAGHVVAYWLARGSILADMLGSVGDMTLGAGVPDVRPGGLAFGNATAVARACYAVSDAAWKPTAAITIAALCSSPAGGATGTYLFGTEAGGQGWGCYNFATGSPHMYLRVGGAWADQAVTGTMSPTTPQLVGMTFDGSTFAARWGAAKTTQSISGAITQSSASLDLPNVGGGATPYGFSAAMFHAFLILDRALDDAWWADLAEAPHQMLRAPLPAVARASSRNRAPMIFMHA